MSYVLYTNLGRDYLFDWDEGIYGELGRQITLRSAWFTTFFNGAVWFEKPPGVAWISALGIMLAGDSSFGSRLLFPLVALYTLATTYAIGKKIGNWQTGLFAAGLLTTFNLFLGRTRAVNTDMPLLASINTTILLLLTNRAAGWVALSIFFGVWFKGLAGFLSLLISLPLLIHKSKKYVLCTMYYVLLLILPWHLYSYLRYGSEFLNPYFFEQVITRATNQIEFHFEPVWYYFAYLYENLGLGVLIVAGISILIALFELKKTRSLSSPNILLLWWLLFPLALFSLAKTRLFWYILPIYPALALLIAYGLNALANNKLAKNIYALLACGVLIQGVMVGYRSVEPNKVVVDMPDRLKVAHSLRSDKPILVLVPESERLAEALLPEVARLSSSFRYGGMPSFVYYYHGPVEFFYNVDTFNDRASSHPYALMVSRADLPKLTFAYHIVAESSSYLGLTSRGIYAQR